MKTLETRREALTGLYESRLGFGRSIAKTVDVLCPNLVNHSFGFVVQLRLVFAMGFALRPVGFQIWTSRVES